MQEGIGRDDVALGFGGDGGGGGPEEQWGAGIRGLTVLSMDWPRWAGVDSCYIA
jgi:hypothetical protein